MSGGPSATRWARAFVGLRRRPGLLGAAAATGLVVGLVAAAPVLFVSSVGAGAVQVQDDAVCPAATGPTVNVRRGTDGSLADPLPAMLAAAALDRHFAVPERLQANYSANPVTAPGGEAAIGFLVGAHAREHIDLLTPETPGDVLIPDTLATALGATNGTALAVELRDGRVEQLVVSGVFRDLSSAPLGRYWCAARDAIVPATLYGEIYPPPMGIVSKATYEAHELDIGLRFSRYVAPFAAAPRTLADARADSRATESFAAAIASTVPGGSVTAGISRLDERARLVRQAIAETITPVAVLGLVCALALAAVLGALWGRTRRPSCIALVTIGVTPAAIGRKAAAELALAVVSGSLLGGLVARASISWWAPSSSLEPGTVARAMAAAGLAGLVALAPAAITAGWSSRSVLRVASPPRRAWVAYVPVEVALLVATGIAWSRLDHQQALPIEGRRVVDTGSSALLFPLAALALAAVVAARLWWLATRRRRRTTLPRHLAGRLAFRRLQHGSTAGAALLAAGTLALGVSVYGTAMTVSLGRTADAKAGVFIGAEVSYLIAGSLPPGTPDATEVWRRESMTYAGAPVDLLAVDPRTLARAAFWDSAFADHSLATLVGELGVGEGGIRAVLVGEAPLRGSLTNPGRPGTASTIEVVDRAAAFPGARSTRPTLVMSVEGAEASGISFQRYVWARGELKHWREELLALGAKPVYGSSSTEATDGSALRFASWSFDFVGALGVFVGVLVVSALLLHLVTRQRQQALGFAFLRRMGMSARRHGVALALEVGGLVAAIAALGATVGVLCARVVASNIDPLPSLPPSTLSVVPWVGLIVVFLTGLVVVVLGSGTAQAVGARSDVSEMLRDGT